MLQTIEAPTPQTAAPVTPTKEAPRLTLDMLSAMSFEELSDKYKDAPSPETLTAVDGKPRGRMLAVKTVSKSSLGVYLRRFAASKSFVWDGKTFTSSSDKTGRGINRVQLPGVLGRQILFPFETWIGASVVDGRPAIILNYDLSENPAYIRRIHDEIREVAPGLYMGPAAIKTKSGPVTALWFALDTRTPSTW